MCNLAGYCGERNAAPILFDMIKRQEGFCGGYYTGISTYHNEKLYCEKVVGAADVLAETTDAEKLPGTVGIMHSRSNSGGGRVWAHPFLGKKGDTPEIAYIANGITGIFKENTSNYSEYVRELLKDGYHMDAIESDNPNYIGISDGMRVHMSDVMCQLILSKMKSGLDEVKAMESAYTAAPAEIVGLMLSLKNPDRIFYSRINMPMFVGFASHGVYLATTPTAFPDDAGEPILLPALSAGSVAKDGLNIHPYTSFDKKVAGIDSDIKSKVHARIKETLKTGPKSFEELEKKVLPLVADEKFHQIYAVIYDVLYALKKRNEMKMETIFQNGTPKIIMKG